MYQPAHLDSFLRLLITHIGSVITQGEQLLEETNSNRRMDLLQYFVEEGTQNADHLTPSTIQAGSETLFLMQLSQAREWVDRLGQLDPDIERVADEFLAATYSINSILPKVDQLDNIARAGGQMAGPGNDNGQEVNFVALIDVELMLCEIFEFLGRLEEQYDLMEELLEVKQVANGIPFDGHSISDHSAKIIPLFGRPAPGTSSAKVAGSE